MRGTERDAQRAAAGLVSDADGGRIPLTKETFGGLLISPARPQRSPGATPRTLVENRRIAAATAEEQGSNDLQKLKGSDLDAFCDRLSPRGLSATSRPVQHVGAGMIPFPGPHAADRISVSALRSSA